MTEKNQLVAIYGRVSSERQEKEGTVESQIAEIEKAIAANGDICVKTYIDDGYSGELLERPDLDQLRTDAGKHLFSKVYILSPDRLSRLHHHAAIIMEDLNRNGVEVVFANRPIGETMEDKLLFNVQSVFAEYEKAKIIDRMRRGKLFKVRQGNVLGNTPPYGYRYVKDEKSRRGWYEVDEKEAEIVKVIFSIYLSEDCSGLGALRKELYERNIKNRSGSNNWSQSMVARVISNETYIGITHWGKFKSVEGDPGGGYRRLKNTKRVKKAKEDWLAIEVPPIIDREAFKKTEVKRATNKSLSPNNVRETYLLRGLMVHTCGARMYSKMCHGQKYYVCSNRKNAFPKQSTCDGSRHYNAEVLEALVWNELKKETQSPAMLLRRIKQKENNKDTAKEKIESRILEIDKSLSRSEEKKSRMLLAYSEGILTLEDLRTQKEDIEKELRIQLEEKGSLSKKLNVTFQEPPKKMDLQNFSQRIKIAQAKADPLKRQKLFRYFISQIQLDGDTAVVNAFLPKELFVVPTATLS